MRIYTSIKSLQSFLDTVRAIHELPQPKKKIGFVPTMGALHKGHLELIKAAKKISNIVVVSIFVNPIQFGPKEDFKKYPRNIKKDKSLLKKMGVNVLFLPNAKEMYSKNHKTFVNVNNLSEKLCGKYRPGHFAGVATVVAKLFNIVKPDFAFFGEKDFQQLAIIKKMAKDLNLDIAIKSIPTAREKDGLAMSSRNAYLSKEERDIAPTLYKGLLLAKSMIKNGQKDTETIKNTIRKFILKEKQFKIQYISICDPNTLDDLNSIKKTVLIALAAYLDKTRLIDNILLS